MNDPKQIEKFYNAVNADIQYQLGDSMLTKTYDVVYWDEGGKKEIINSFPTMEQAQLVFFKCMEGDKEAQINASYDIEESYQGVPGY
jgi:hypothetical protein